MSQIYEETVLSEIKLFVKSSKTSKHVLWGSTTWIECHPHKTSFAVYHANQVQDQVQGQVEGPILKVASCHQTLGTLTATVPCKTSICGLSGEHFQSLKAFPPKFCFTKCKAMIFKREAHWLTISSKWTNPTAYARFPEKPERGNLWNFHLVHFRSSPFLECPGWYLKCLSC